MVPKAIGCSVIALFLLIVTAALSAEPPCPAPTDPQFGCNTTSSTPIVADHDRQVISGIDLYVDATGQPGINTNGKNFVKICSVRIHHSNGGAFNTAQGIFVNGGKGVEIHNVNIIDDSGWSAPATDSNIKCLNSPGLWAENVRVENGATGIELINCPANVLQVIEGHTITGDHEANTSPGTFVQWLNTNTGSLTDFYLKNRDKPANAGGTNGDGVGAYISSNITVANGFIDGLYGPVSCGVQDDLKTNNMTVHDVTVNRMLDGAFCIYGSGGSGGHWYRMKASNNICGSTQGFPSSGTGAMWVGACSAGNPDCRSGPKRGVRFDSPGSVYQGYTQCNGTPFPTAPVYNIPGFKPTKGVVTKPTPIVAKVCK